MKTQTATTQLSGKRTVFSHGFGFDRGSSRRNSYDVVTINDAGELVEKPERLARLRTASSGICVRLQTGNCLLRRLSIESLNTREIEPALELWAEESLPEPVESYYLDSWAISATVRGLAALPRVPLQRVRQTLEDMGLAVLALHVPELRAPKSAGVSIVLHRTDNGRLFCLWKDQVLVDWQIFVPNIATRTIIGQMAAACPETPACIYLEAATLDNNARVELESVWPGTRISYLDSENQSAENQRFAAGLAFNRFTREVEELDATHKEKQKLGFALAAVMLAGVFLLFASVTQLQREVAYLQHQVSLFKVRANRSEQVASRSGDALRRVRELRAITAERQDVMTILKVLSDTLPPRTKLERFTIERNGFTLLDGTAETELDVSTLLERFKRTELFTNPTLTYIQKEETRSDQNPLVRFRLEAQLAQPMLSLPGDKEEAGSG